ncbi:MAG: type II toxin-antitoxin system YafQ family toxin [Cloacibacillus sp.]
MRELDITNQYKKDLRRAVRQGRDTDKLDEMIFLLLNDECIPEKNKDHDLKGGRIGFRELHLEPDWLLIYEKPDELRLTLTRLGSHSELF